MELLSSHASFSLFDERCPLSNTKKKRKASAFFLRLPRDFSPPKATTTLDRTRLEYPLL